MEAVKEIKTKYLFTFDYELFLGPETGTVERCLINPTDRLLSIGQQSGVRFVFFVDTLYLLKLKEMSTNNKSLELDYEKIVAQLRTASQDGHDIELHLHPQWYYSSFNSNDNKWDLDYSHYKLTDCPFSDVEKMVYDSCELIKSITGVLPRAYRAGGYSAPNSLQHWNLLKNHGVKYDSSVIVGEKVETCFQSYDYSKITTPESYFFSSSNVVNDSNGELIELPIPCIRIRKVYRALIERPLIHFQRRKLSIYGDGKGVGYLYNSEQVVSTPSSIFDFVRLKSTIDFRNTIWLRLFIRKSINKIPFLVFIGHPKNQTQYSLDSLERLFRNRRIAKNVITFRDLA